MTALWTSRRFRFHAFRSQVSKSQHGMLRWACPLSVEVEDISVAHNFWRVSRSGLQFNNSA